MNPSEEAVGPSSEAISPSSEEVSPPPAGPQEAPKEWFRQFQWKNVVAMDCEFVEVFDHPNEFDRQKETDNEIERSGIKSKLIEKH